MLRQWQIRSQAPALKEPDLNPVVWQILYNRGLRTKEQIEQFLYPELALTNYDPNDFREMSRVVELIVSHIKVQNKIVVCGDYDADGVSASAIMTEALNVLKAKVDVWIPSRFGQGYGLNKGIIKELKDNNVSLIITVDNGIRAKEEIAYAKELGIDVIVTDHHEGPIDNNDLPNCLIINPILKDETYPFKYLCGAGVALKLAQALINRSTLAKEDKQKLYERLVALAALGTVADCVSLLGENRLLVQQGLEILNRRPRLGLRALMEIIGINPGELSEWNISWQITPRLNVAGRLEHANTAYKLLITNDLEEARKIAADLQTKNIERQAMTNLIVEAAILEIEKNQKEEKLLVVISPNVFDDKLTAWNEGVIGLAAGRLAEKFNKPCLVITKSEGAIKGSGRSIEQCDLALALETGAEYLERYGGHKMACGFTIKDFDVLDKFIKSIKSAVEKQLNNLDLSPILEIDSAMQLSEVTDDFIEMIEKCAPFGQDNPEPIFMSHSVIEEIMVMGKEKNHIKFRLGGLWALAFNRSKEFSNLEIGQAIDVAYTVCFNIFNGRREAQIKIIELKTV